MVDAEVSNTIGNQKIAELFSGRLMRAQDVLHAAGMMARVLEQKPALASGDRDLAALIGIVTLVQEEFEGLMDDVSRCA